MSNKQLIQRLKKLVGRKNVLTRKSSTAYYRTGWRYGFGGATAVIFPNSLLQYWQVLETAVEGNCIVILQSAKTGLTGGSCPNGFDYDREVLIVNTSRLKGIALLDGGKQVLAFPGTTLFELTQKLKSIGRVPHSVLGSTTIGATVIGGIANNAGGALCKRGCSYTELSLFARVNESKQLELVNHLGIRNLGSSPREIFTSLENESFSQSDLQDFDKPASDRDYKNRIRNLDAETPNRFNADPARLFDVSGSAGKVAAFAVRVDTYPAPKKTQVFMLGTNDPEHFATFRKSVLKNFANLPEMCEYLNRSTFDTAQKYGKDVALAIKFLGTKRLPNAYALKAKAEYFFNKIPLVPKYLPDIFLYYASKLFLQHLPASLLKFRDEYKYYLILVTADEAIDESRQYLANDWGKTAGVGYFECNEKEQEAALLHRFSAAGAGIRYRNLHQKTTEEVLALDIALLSSDASWIEELPDEITKDMDLALYYGHYLCHVFHHVYVFKKGADIEQVKALMLQKLKSKGAKYPAEHNVGHMYEAEQPVKHFYSSLDPTNTFNPGIGQTSKLSRPEH